MRHFPFFAHTRRIQTLRGKKCNVTPELIVAAEAGEVRFALRLNYLSLRFHRPTSVVVCQRWETDGEVEKKARAPATTSGHASAQRGKEVGFEKSSVRFFIRRWRSALLSAWVSAIIMRPTLYVKRVAQPCLASFSLSGIEWWKSQWLLSIFPGLWHDMSMYPLPGNREIEHQSARRCLGVCMQSRLYHLVVLYSCIKFNQVGIQATRVSSGFNDCCHSGAARSCGSRTARHGP